MLSLTWRSMGRRCPKKAVMCGAIGVLVLACAIGSLSLASRDAARRRDFLTVPRYRPRRSGWLLACLDRVFPLFAVISAFPWQILLHGQRCPASVPAPLPNTNTCGPLCYDQDRSITPACVW